MLNVSLIIGTWRRPWKSYYENVASLSKNKTFEIQLMSANALIGFTLDLTFWGRDHAGPELSLYLLGYELALEIHDNRHWNHKKWRWYKLGEEEEA